ncbi:hypothetical protein [Vreelandella vilamensis]|uniref:hypothetical protein n=1 Tax=Vreelandella vilamensis TaxID=531309 RepID=UPI00286C3F0A|nr:hypothetical protein [Halomonas vilamensis]
MALVECLPGNTLGLWLLISAPMVVLEKLIAAIVLFAMFVTLCRVRLPVNRVSLFNAGSRGYSRRFLAPSPPSAGH